MTTGIVVGGVVFFTLIAIVIAPFILSGRVSREEERRSDLRASQPWRR